MSKEIKLITTIAVDWNNDEGVEETDIDTQHNFEDPDEIDSIFTIHEEKVQSIINSFVKKSKRMEAEATELPGENEDD